jgi:hypothetical protein
VVALPKRGPAPLEEAPGGRGGRVKGRQGPRTKEAPGGPVEGEGSERGEVIWMAKTKKKPKKGTGARPGSQPAQPGA